MQSRSRMTPPRSNSRRRVTPTPGMPGFSAGHISTGGDGPPRCSNPQHLHAEHQDKDWFNAARQSLPPIETLHRRPRHPSAARTPPTSLRPRARDQAAVSWPGPAGRLLPPDDLFARFTNPASRQALMKCSPRGRVGVRTTCSSHGGSEACSTALRDRTRRVHPVGRIASSSDSPPTKRCSWSRTGRNGSGHDPRRGHNQRAWGEPPGWSYRQRVSACGLAAVALLASPVAEFGPHARRGVFLDYAQTLAALPAVSTARPPQQGRCGAARPRLPHITTSRPPEAAFDAR